MIAQNIILPYDGTNASIPAGFTRDTSFDGKFVIHSNTGTGATGGSNTHTHTSISHNHALNNHTHTISFGYYEEIGAGASENHENPKRRHTHGSVITSSMSSANSSSNSFTTGSANNIPHNYAVIFIKSTGYNLLPANAIFYSSKTISGFSLCDGNGGTPNLNGRFLRGAGTGQNAGTFGGNNSHNHSANHSHTGANHNHTGTSGFYSGPKSKHGGADSGTGVYDHRHPFTTNGETASISSYSGSCSTATTQPPYYSLLTYKNMTGSAVAIKDGLIALTKETTLPIGWILCDGNNGTPNLASRFILSHSQANLTGGNSSHTHSNLNHTHTSTPHNHGGTTNSVSSETYQAKQGSSWRGRSPHAHSLTSTSSVASYSNSNISFNSSNSVPEYIEVKFIMATAQALGGTASIINNFI